MSDKKMIITIKHHQDDDIGMCKVGAISFGYDPSILKEYVEKYGAVDLLRTLNYFIIEVVGIDNKNKLEKINKDNKCKL